MKSRILGGFSAPSRTRSAPGVTPVSFRRRALIHGYDGKYLDERVEGCGGGDTADVNSPSGIKQRLAFVSIRKPVNEAAKTLFCVRVPRNQLRNLVSPPIASMLHDNEVRSTFVNRPSIMPLTSRSVFVNSAITSLSSRADSFSVMTILLVCVCYRQRKE